MRTGWFFVLIALSVVACKSRGSDGSSPGKGTAIAGESCMSQAKGGNPCVTGLVCYRGGEGAVCMTQADANAACRKTNRCKIGGGCTYHRGIGNCISTKEEDCKRSEACKKRGKCSLSDKACVVMKDEDCAGSDLCKNEKKCKAKPDSTAGACVES